MILLFPSPLIFPFAHVLSFPRKYAERNVLLVLGIVGEGEEREDGIPFENLEHIGPLKERQFLRGQKGGEANVAIRLH